MNEKFTDVGGRVLAEKTGRHLRNIDRAQLAGCPPALPIDLSQLLGSRTDLEIGVPAGLLRPVPQRLR